MYKGIMAYPSVSKLVSVCGTTSCKVRNMGYGYNPTIGGVMTTFIRVIIHTSVSTLYPYISYTIIRKPLRHMACQG